jgi:hypothetical protein
VFSLPEADVYIVVIVMTDIKAYKYKYASSANDGSNNENGQVEVTGSGQSEQPLSGIVLPTHIRCASHTLSLIGATDASKALKNLAAFSVLIMLLRANVLPYGIPAEISRNHSADIWL